MKVRSNRRRNIVGELLALVVCCACGVAEDSSGSGTGDAELLNYAGAFSSYDSARAAEASDDYAAAATHWFRAGEQGFEPRQAYMSAIAYSLAAGDTLTALAAAKQLADAGHTDSRPFESDPNFNAIESLAGWGEIRAQIDSNRLVAESSLSNPSNARIETGDIDRFWMAFDSAAVLTDSAKIVAVYSELYFVPASRGLRDFTFLKMRGGIPDFVQFVETHREYYEGVREPAVAAIDNLKQLPEYLEAVKRLIPDATFPGYTFVIGRHTSFGTASLSGSIIGLENVVDENTPVDLLPLDRQDVVAPASMLPFVLIHELMHTYQQVSGQSLLAKTLAEGGADFLTELAVGPPVPTPSYRTFGAANQAEVWQIFVSQMDGDDTSLWIGAVSPEAAPIEGWPRDMAYFVGYKIAQSYYEQAEDKATAIQDLLDLDDPIAILSTSGYSGAER